MNLYRINNEFRRARERSSKEEVKSAKKNFYNKCFPHGAIIGCNCFWGATELQEAYVATKIKLVECVFENNVGRLHDDVTMHALAFPEASVLP